MVGTRHSPMATRERLQCFIPFFHMFLTLSRIDRIFINLLLTEARDFHCSSHVVENLGKKTIPSDHAAVRLVIQKPANRRHQSERIPSWMSKQPIFCSILQQLHDDHRFSPDSSVHLLNLKFFRTTRPGT